jgi:hypothetical protein
MPLIRIDGIEGRSHEQIKNLLRRGAPGHSVGTSRVPLRDRYQIYHERSKSSLVVQDTGLRIEQTRNVVVITVTSRPRKPEAKQRFFQDLSRFEDYL